MAQHVSQQDIDRLLALYNGGKFAELVAEAETLIASHPSSPLLHLLAGAGFTSLNKLDEAVQSYREALRLQPDYWDALNNLGVVLRRLGRLDEAALCYQRMLSIKPKDVDVLSSLAGVFQLQKNWDAAISHYNAVLEQSPGQAAVHGTLAAIQRSLGNFDQALLHLRQVAALNSDDIDAKTNVGLVLADLGRADEAASAFQTVLRLDPRRADVLAHLALALKRSDRVPEALQSYREALAIEPNATEALLNIANLLVRSNKYDEARPFILRLLTLDLPQRAALGLARIVVEAGQVADVPSRIDYGGRALTLAEVADDTDKMQRVAVSASVDVPTTPRLNLSTNENNPSPAFAGLPATLLELQRAECVYPNIVIAGDALIKSNNSYPTLELAAHGALPEVEINVSGGLLRFNIKKPDEATPLPRGAALLNAGEHYGTWIMGELPRLHLYEAQAPGRPIALHGEVRPFHLESLAACGVTGPIVRVPASHRIVGEGLLYATPTFNYHTTSLASLAYVRDKMRESLGKGIDRGKSIYVSRSRLGMKSDRNIVNEVEIENRLSAEGFEIIHPQDLTLAEQVRVFVSARRILAPFGAALANGLFCDTTTQVCIIATKHTPEFSRIFQWLGVTQYLITPHSQRRAASNRFSTAMEFSVDLADIENFLKATA